MTTRNGSLVAARRFRPWWSVAVHLPQPASRVLAESSQNHTPLNAVHPAGRDIQGDNAPIIMKFQPNPGFCVCWPHVLWGWMSLLWKGHEIRPTFKTNKGFMPSDLIGINDNDCAPLGELNLINVMTFKETTFYPLLQDLIYQVFFSLITLFLTDCWSDCHSRSSHALVANTLPSGNT